MTLVANNMGLGSSKATSNRRARGNPPRGWADTGERAAGETAELRHVSEYTRHDSTVIMILIGNADTTEDVKNGTITCTHSNSNDRDEETKEANNSNNEESETESESTNDEEEEESNSKKETGTDTQACTPAQALNEITDRPHDLPLTRLGPTVPPSDMHSASTASGDVESP